MPNRILRDWTDSEKISALSPQAERFFTRLIMKADDYGCFHGNSKLLRSALFPLIIDCVFDESVTEWVNECKSAELLQTYSVNGKDYVQILDFRQRLRNKVSRFPLPESEAVKTQELKTQVINHFITDISQGPIVTDSQNLLEAYFYDFPNSSHAENISKMLKVDKSVLIASLPEFRKSANLSYPNAVKFAEHFKNWYLKRKTTSNTDAPIKAGYTPKI